MDIKTLRRFAINNTLFKPTTLGAAMQRLGFVQADPIRSPARAQDLILRHRVKDYHIGDLDKHYKKLNLEEDFLYAYGYFSPIVVPLLHPKKRIQFSDLEQQLMDFIKAKKSLHPRDLSEHFGSETERNWWGGNSKSTKMALDHLHYHGHIRVMSRHNGIRTYEAMNLSATPLPDLKRIRQLTLLIVSILQPVTEARLTGALNYLRHFSFDRNEYTARKVVDALVSSGALVREKVDGISYLWKPEDVKVSQIPDTVKFLAPFDPVVWDRTRFEHLWGWPYRFEAYVPAAKRIRGYYSLPLLWGENIIGWVNMKKGINGVEFETGFVGKRPSDKKFEKELNEEIERMMTFLHQKESQSVE